MQNRHRRLLRATLSSLFAAVLLSPWQPALAQFRQDGNMLGSSCDGLGGGGSVALSGDGTTAIVSGGDVAPLNISAYVYTVTSDAWSQQGCGLRATGFPAAAGAVAVSADGNTVIQAAPTEQVGPSAYSLAWVFTRSCGTWSQVLLVGNASGGTIALSSDGNTAILGGLNDNNQVGAAWVFTRSDGVWTQLAKLVGDDAIANPYVHQGYSVALSGDGNTAIVGGPQDNAGAGAVWVFTRSGGQWTQQGSKLVGTGAVGTNVNQGRSVGLSADGNLAIIGGPFDNGGPLGNEVGAAWLFAGSGSTWSQLQKLASGEANFPQAWFGLSVALSADGRTALIGAPGVVNGGSFVFIAPSRWPTDTHDFNGDGKSDLLWRDTSGDANSGSAAVWLMNGTQILQAAGLATVPTAWTIAATGDFNGDGKADLLWQNTTIGDVGIWLMNGSQVLQAASVATVPTAWTIAGTGDFNRDGEADLLWRNTTTGDVGIWFMNGTQILQAAGLATVPTTWSIVGTGDFNGDGLSGDILWRDASGNTAIWFMNEGNPQPTSAGIGNVPASWSIVDTGDYDGDGMTDVLWRDTSANVAIWFMFGPQVRQAAGVATVPTVWSLQGTNVD